MVHEGRLVILVDVGPLVQVGLMVKMGLLVQVDIWVGLKQYFDKHLVNITSIYSNMLVRIIKFS